MPDRRPRRTTPTAHTGQTRSADPDPRRGDESLLPPPSRRVLTGLAARPPLSGNRITLDATPVRRAFVELTALLAAQETALAQTDRIIADLAAPFGSDPAALRPADRMRRQGDLYRKAAEAAGLPAAEARDLAIAARIHDTTSSLLLAPSGGLPDLAVKLAVLISLSEPGPPDADRFPGLYLRALLADVHGLHPG